MKCWGGLYGEAAALDYPRRGRERIPATPESSRALQLTLDVLINSNEVT
jgi:hypothetical protein